ncbi:monocarboxylate transporter [Pyrenophora tritici-repentis]|uniref:Major Facilitator Superprotein n=1 Tax=Pyrenophora tritici-repentis TaxID=45151 RepID=A0A2W1DYG6_9PLEO|nr:ProP Permease major facilitator superfamily [Pyrenophora tritici-repentis]KAI1518149.1 Major Facilitator Superprotein [Pyrenophora tritici-repentis]KAI1545226.1 monocarboxylate transporter [Pyrenophora tritici-repentis]KAI1551235.1 monocarboxylate transporter [Pyrenophora tritici-repentis]KAI1557332.1 monocarboxylate transporter [Pyrenophora tritici-repentis]
MASIPQLSISSTDVPLLYEEKGHLSQTHHSPYNQNPSSQNKAPPPLSNTPEPTYPEGGLLAWSVVLGAFSGISASIGIYNSSGIFEAYVSTELLPDLSKTSIGWIFGIYTFVTWFLGVQIRPTALMVAERVCTLWGIFALSRCTEYYQALAFSILNATGSSLLVTPANASVAHWFNTCRGLASGAAFVGGSFGGVIFPLLLQSLIPKIACPWSLRVLGLILLLLCDTSVVLCRSRLPPPSTTLTTIIHLAERLPFLAPLPTPTNALIPLNPSKSRLSTNPSAGISALSRLFAIRATAIASSMSVHVGTW